MGKALGIVVLFSIACGGAATRTDAKAGDARSGEPAEPAADLEPTGDGNGPDDPELLARVDEFVDEACACKDPACAAEVDERLAAWVKNEPEPSERDEQLISDSFELISECTDEVSADKQSNLVGLMTALTNEICACKNMACAKDVQRRLVEGFKNEKTPTQAETQRIQELMKQMAACIGNIQANP